MSAGVTARLARDRRWAGIAALVTGVLFGVANALWALEQPARGASAVKVLHFYGHASGRIVAGGLLSLVAMGTLLVFGAALRGVLAALEGDDLLANVAFGGAVVTAGAGVAAESINMAAALRAGDGTLTAPVGQALFDVSFVFGYNAAGIGFGVLVLATCAVALRARTLLPRWLAVVGVVLGVALLTPLSYYGLAAAFVFLLVLGVLLVRAPSAARGA